MHRVLAALASMLLAGAALAQSNLVDSEGRPVRFTEVPFVTTADSVVKAMLDLAEVSSKDVVYDLGCGDGRIVIAAARDRGARGVGIEIDDRLVDLARSSARNAGVESRVRIEPADLFETDYREATVVMLYLSDSFNERLWPKFERELKPGTRIVSHKFRMGSHVPERTVSVGHSTLYLWRIR